MAEFEGFLRSIRCPLPAVAAPVSVWVQFISGLLILLGLLTRWAGLLLAVNFVVAVVLLGSLGQDFRQLFPPAVLIFIGVLLATGGAGPLSMDRMLSGRRF